MEIVFEILKVVLPAITTGLFTFIITKYTYNKNRPLDKLEIAYNRIYYPIYKIISDKNIDMDTAIDKINIYLLKYNKYVDISTKRIFKLLCECKKETQKKSIYQKFKDNIYNRNSYLRRKLGYLEPGFFQLYKYSLPSTKSFIRLIGEFCVMYMSVVLSTILTNFENKIYVNVTLIIFSLFTLIFILELVWCFLRFLYYKIRK